MILCFDMERERLRRQFGMGRVKSRMKRFAAVVLSLAVMVPVGVFGTSQTAKADGPTGAGLAAHAMTAYNEGWAYSYGSASPAESVQI